MTGERADLLETLAKHRYFLRYTVRDLTDEQAAQRTTVSELCLGGLIKHVAFTEREWINFILHGPSAMGHGEQRTSNDRSEGFRMLPGETLEIGRARPAVVVSSGSEDGGPGPLLTGKVVAVKLLVLGGTRFVGRAVVRDALSRGWDVTAVHRGVTGALSDGVTTLLADRSSEPELMAALRDCSWDVVVDTWSGAPAVTETSARLLSGRVKRYGYVSSMSVYAWGSHVDERSPLVNGDPRAQDGDYPALKRGAELAVLDAFPDALLCRAGLILGPHEDIGRLPWWLDRISRGGRVVAPGRPSRPLQYVDARDLAAWLLSGLSEGLTGAVDVASRSGHTTTQELLAACIAAVRSDARLIWIAEVELAAAGAQPWTQLPCWVPEGGEFAGFLEADTSLAAATGLVCRPVDQTVNDTWSWLQRDGRPEQRPDRAIHGLPLELEKQLLAKA